MTGEEIFNDCEFFAANAGAAMSVSISAYPNKRFMMFSSDASMKCEDEVRHC